MRLIQNIGTDRVIDHLRSNLKPQFKLDLMTNTFSLFALSNLRNEIINLSQTRLIIPSKGTNLNFLGGKEDRAYRNQLQTQWLAKHAAAWIENNVECRFADDQIPQGMMIIRDRDNKPILAILGSLSFSTMGLGTTPGNPLDVIQISDTPEETQLYGQWFEKNWDRLPSDDNANLNLIRSLTILSEPRSPHSIYAGILNVLFSNLQDNLDEEQIVKAATGIRNTVIWKKLFKFQRDGVIGAIDKLNRFGGCIIADSVGLGKTFEALAVIKYFELRNNRVLVLCPKRLRDNWTLYKANDQRNFLAPDRFNYDVINHTDLSRNSGMTGDIDLAHINWGNYDLVVIDESHNFRNKPTPQNGSETRYDRLMRRIIKEGVKTRVLMLSATPVNNRLADLKNQIAFATEGDDTALYNYGINSINSTTQQAQKQFNRWMQLDEAERTPSHLIEMLGFDYFTLLDLLTIARSRKHIIKYYDIRETGSFPKRLKPINIKADVDLDEKFPSVKKINLEIRKLKLASYAPLSYVLPNRLEAYEKKYDTAIRGGETFFKQVDREKSLIDLIRINVLKRMESAVSSFALTIERQLNDVEKMLDRIEKKTDEVEEINIEDMDIDDPTFESLLVGKKIKVLLKDVDLIRWKQDLDEDRNRLQSLFDIAQQVTAERDAKLAKLREIITKKCQSPINPGNRKVIIFTAFADTAQYLYKNLAPWAKNTLGLETALVTGTGSNQVTIPGLHKDLSTILTAFSPISKERPAKLADEGELDLLIATDCISEGQNLQDCDWLINYDIHWNPVRIIQRFGRIDRIGSRNQSIQLVNFWPNMELEEYINLEQRVSGRMVLMDISATGEENVIEEDSGNQMNDLEYRRKQLLKLQETVIDLEDLATGVSITDLTLTDFRIDLAEYNRSHPSTLNSMPFGAFAVTKSTEKDIEPGIIFCLRAEGDMARKISESGYPLSPHYLIHVGQDGTVVLPYVQARQILDHLKRICVGCDLPDFDLVQRFEKTTKGGEDMHYPQKMLSAAVSSVIKKSEERAIESLFTPGGTHAFKGEFAGMNDFEVIAYLVILPERKA